MPMSAADNVCVSAKPSRNARLPRVVGVARRLTRERKFIVLTPVLRALRQTSSARNASRNQTSLPPSNAMTSKRHAG